MKIKNYTRVEHFINDQSFKNWLNKTDLSDFSFWENWISKNPEKEYLVNSASDIIKGINFNQSYISDETVNKKWELLKDEIEDAAKKSPLLSSKIIKTRVIAIAASLALLISSYLIFNYNKADNIVHKTGYGEIINLKLSDGTKVILNSNSKLAYKSDKPRFVQLVGEAFFEVSKIKSSDSKFSVATKDLEVQVYGTEFNVNSRNTKTQVFLQEGKVDLKLKNGIYKEMIPGDLFSYSHAKNLIVEERKILKPELQTSWKEGSLIFDKATLQEAISKIEETYGVSTVFEDESIKKIILTGAIPTKDLNIALKTIEKSAQIEIVNKNNKLYIRKK